MTASVEVCGLTKTFGDLAALANVSMTVEAGQFAVLLGPSGCGKSTLLSVLGGFLTPTEGRVLIAGEDLTYAPPTRRPTTTVFQDYALFPHMSLSDNVGFGLRMRGVARAARRRRGLEFLELVGLKESAGKRPHELSGGQRQRVALARALAVEPEVLLLDEPLGALDLKLRRQMQDELKAIQRRVGTTFVHVTHDQEEAMAIADKIIVMNRGRIEDTGYPADIYTNPKSLFSAGFMGEINFLPGVVRTTGEELASVETAFGVMHLPLTRLGNVVRQANAVVTICIRPEHFRDTVGAEAEMGMLDLGPARIVDSAFFGTHHRCHLVSTAAPDTVLIAHLPQATEVSDGDLIRLRVDPARVVVLPIGDI